MSSVNLSTYLDVFRNLLLFGGMPREQLFLELFCVLLLINVLDTALLLHLVHSQSVKLRQLTVFKIARRLMLTQQSRMRDWYLLPPTYDGLQR